MGLNLEVGQHYGYAQQPRRPGDPLLPVEFIRSGPPRLQKARIRWLDGPYEGLEEWVSKRRILVPWNQADVFLDDERRLEVVLAASRHAIGTDEREAVQVVWLTAIPELKDAGLDWSQKLPVLLEIDDLCTVVDALRGPTKEELLAEPMAFVDRHGAYRAPFAVAAKLARLVCVRYSGDILAHLASIENAYEKAKISRYYCPPWSGDGWPTTAEQMEKRLMEVRPIHARVRAWCGAEAVARFDEVRQLRSEVARLRDLIESTARFLSEAGHPVKARCLSRELQSGKLDSGRGRH